MLDYGRSEKISSISYEPRRAALRLTGGQAAALMGLSDSRQVRKYTVGDQPRTIPYSGLYTLIHRATGRAISQDHWRLELSDLLS